MFKKNKMAALKVMFCTWLIFVHEVWAHNCTIVPTHTLHFHGTQAEHVLAFKFISEWTFISFWFIHTHSQQLSCTEWSVHSHLTLQCYPVSLFHTFPSVLSFFKKLFFLFSYFSAGQIFSSNMKWNRSLSPPQYVSSYHRSQYLQYFWHDRNNFQNTCIMWTLLKLRCCDHPFPVMIMFKRTYPHLNLPEYVHLNCGYSF